MNQQKMDMLKSTLKVLANGITVVSRPCRGQRGAQLDHSSLGLNAMSVQKSRHKMNSDLNLSCSWVTAAEPLRLEAQFNHRTVSNTHNTLPVLAFYTAVGQCPLPIYCNWTVSITHVLYCQCEHAILQVDSVHCISIRTSHYEMDMLNQHQ